MKGKPKSSLAPDRPAVFSIITDTVCDECGAEINRGDYLRPEGKKGLCLKCADLDHLVFLGSGDAALTRRAGKHSSMSFIVLRWSKARKHYERQGVLVEEEALEKAEAECLSDADAREARRMRSADRREVEDAEYVAAFARRVRELYPYCPQGEEDHIARHAAQKYSGRVGRSAAAKEFEARAIGLAVAAHVRHVYTNYDHLLGMGWERHEARAEIRAQMDEVLAKWEG